MAERKENARTVTRHGRGYSLREMERIKRKSAERQTKWVERFDSYVDTILHEDILRSNALIIERAKDLANKRQACLDELLVPELEDE